MRSMKNVTAVLIAFFFTGILLTLSVPAHADWIENGMRLGPVPNFDQGHPVVLHTPSDVDPPVRHDQPTEHHQDRKDHKSRSTDFWHHRQDDVYFTYVDLSPVVDIDPVVVVNPIVNLNPAADGSSDEDVSPAEDISSALNVSPVFAVPDGFEIVAVGEDTYFYSQGIFYQLVGDRLAAIPAVLGAVVSSIPKDHQIVKMGGVNYCVWRGVYYEQVAKGFEVVKLPVSDQG